MRFIYTYRSSDGQRHTAEIEAESRDAAFAKVRTELGIKPIKVVAAEGESGALGDRALPYGRDKRDRSLRKLWGAAILAAAILAVAIGVWWWFAVPAERMPNWDSPMQGVGVFTVDTPLGTVTYAEAQTLERQMIPGSRDRIEEAKARDGVFRFAAEKWLARFAEPGRISFIAINEMNGGKSPARPSEAEFAACLKEPIRIASTDFTEVVDLKRIVTGMKREMNAYLAGGGTVEGYLAELEKRQKLEVSYRERAEQKLNELLATANGQAARSTGDGGRDKHVPPAGDALKAAYAYWLKANAQLQAMGIYPLALPDALRSYQMSLDIEE